MKRRDVLRSLAGVGAALPFDGCGHPRTEPATLTDADVERMAVSLSGISITRGQAAGVQEMLARMRFKGNVDPTVQPSLVFDPEVDVE